MPIWKYGNNIEVSDREVLRTIDALRAACFKCGKENHSDDCPISKLIFRDPLRALIWDFFRSHRSILDILQHHLRSGGIPFVWIFLPLLKPA